jgi:phosphatidylserine/phosphatidylglycerophosphate/cardiolipin synthase-like enzyme
MLMRTRSTLTVAALVASFLLACRPPAPPPQVPTGCPDIPPGEPKLHALEVVTSLPVETDLSARGSLPTHLVWRQLIEAARTRIDLWQFYLVSEQGSRLEPVIAALRAAARRGVKIRVLYDRKMAESSSDLLVRLRRLPGIRIAVFDGKAIGGGILHAKAILVDGREAYVGSANFDWRSLEHVHETGFRVASPAVVSALDTMFELDWRRARGQRDAWACAQRGPTFAFPPGFRLVASPAPFLPKGVEPALGALVKLIDGARDQITIQLLSYHTREWGEREPFGDIDSALRRAAQRGVKVRLLVSDWNLSRFQIIGLRDLARVKGIEVRFVSLPQARRGYIPFARTIHSKVMRVDDHLSWVGTSNWGKGYFTKSRNLELIAEDPAVARTLTSLFEDLWSGPHTTRLDPEQQYRAPKHD